VSCVDAYQARTPRLTALLECWMHKAPDQIPGNIDVAAQELLEAAAADRVAMLGGIAKALTKRLLQDNPGIGAREVSERVTAFVKAVRDRLEIAANS